MNNKDLELDDEDIPIFGSEHFREYFETSEVVLGKKPTILDLHSLYTFCIDNLIIDNLTDEFYCLLDDNGLNEYTRIINSFEDKKQELNALFKEFTEKTESAYNIDNKGEVSINSAMFRFFVCLDYRQFKRDYDLLIKNKYMIEIDDGFQWLKSKQCLAEYFGYQKEQKEKRTKWENIEKVFFDKDGCPINGLRDSFKNAYGKYSKDYEYLLKIVGRKIPL
jgi:hypothetical protein